MWCANGAAHVSYPLTFPPPVPQLPLLPNLGVTRLIRSARRATHKRPTANGSQQRGQSPIALLEAQKRHHYFAPSCHNNLQPYGTHAIETATYPHRIDSEKSSPQNGQHPLRTAANSAANPPFRHKDGITLLPPAATVACDRTAHIPLTPQPPRTPHRH